MWIIAKIFRVFFHLFLNWNTRIILKLDFYLLAFTIFVGIRLRPFIRWYNNSLYYFHTIFKINHRSGHNGFATFALNTLTHVLLFPVHFNNLFFITIDIIYLFKFTHSILPSLCTFCLTCLFNLFTNFLFLFLSWSLFFWVIVEMSHFILFSLKIKLKNKFLFKDFCCGKK